MKMAVGDTVNSGVSFLGGGATLNWIPSAGVEIIVMSVGCSAIAGTAPDEYVTMHVRLSNGSATLAELMNVRTKDQHNLRIPTTSSLYLSIYNNTGGGFYVVGVGIQSK